LRVRRRIKEVSVKIFALIQGPDDVCYRYRLAAFAEGFARRGWELVAQPLAPFGWQRWRQFQHARAFDMVILQRKLLGWFERMLLRRAAKCLVYDLDDALFFRDSNSRRPAHEPSRLRKFRATVRMSDLVLVGNHFLEETAAQEIPLGKIRVVPTCVDPRLYPPRQHTEPSATVVWIGSHSTLPSLNAVVPGLQQLATENPDFRLRILCDVFPQWEGVPREDRPWSSATEIHDLTTADIGLSWLPEHPWSLGKCGLKVLQYMAAGLPVVGNPFGIHRELIHDGETGFLVQTPAELARAVQRLAADPALRQRLGDAGRDWVRRCYSVSAWTEPLLEMLEQVRGPHRENVRASRPGPSARSLLACAEGGR